MFEKVLLPTDGSKAAIPARERAFEIVQMSDGELHILHVAEQPKLSGGKTIARKLEEKGERIVEGVGRRAERRGIENVRTHVMRGAAHQAILDYARNNDVDTIVMGTHGRTGVERYVLGSVTERVVRMSDVPVVTVPSKNAE
jgi:nucleotide-binding universal stress UspA family protein